ncbi:MAG: N-acetyltransferase [Actinomycetales bacterium]|nr:N-acetyltransferase [Tetrasphaera sp.]NLW98673.1 N-acetyltransferase [Actinomycetales bacterium]
MTDVVVTNNTSQSRYEAHLDGELAGFAEYRLKTDVIMFIHTEVDSTFEGKGVGGAIARSALDDVRADGSRKVVPLCPFIRSWIDRHPDYQDLVAPARGSW